MKVAFEGIGETVVTFEADEKLKEGTLVKIVDSGKVAAAGANDLFVGVVKAAGERVASVQVKGYVRVKWDGQLEPGSFGICRLCAGENSQVKASKTGREVIVCDANSETGELGIMM